MPTPQLKSNELLGRINDLYGQEKDDLAVRRIRLDAEALKKTDPLGAYNALGALECIMGNIEKSRSNHKAALRLDRSFNTLHNFASSMHNLAEYDESMGYLQELFEMDPGNLHVLSRYISASYETGQLQQAEHLLNEWDKLSPENPYVEAQQILECALAARELELSDDILMPIFKATHKYVFECRFFSEGFYSEVTITDSGPVITLYVFVRGDEDSIVDLNVNFPSYLVERVEEIVPDKLVQFYIPEEEFASERQHG